MDSGQLVLVGLNNFDHMFEHGVVLVAIVVVVDSEIGKLNGPLRKAI